jgi:transposase
LGEELSCRAATETIEVFLKGKRIASHVRSFVKGKYTTNPEHRPASHRAHAEWTPSRIIAWGRTIGPHTGRLIDQVIQSKPHPEQGYRSALGIIRLEKRFGRDRVEKAAEKSLKLGSPSYQTVLSMLKNKMESVPLSSAIKPVKPADQQLDLLSGDNIRGKEHYH